MSTPYLGELRLMSFSFAPHGWARCDGQLLQINQNQALFSLLGTNYGGDGQTTFALPDLRGRTAVSVGQELGIGTKTGEERHTLSVAEIPAHSHEVTASSNNGDQPTPSILAAANNLYTDPGDLVAIRPDTIANTGAGQGHENRQPYLTLNWCIALAGVFPSQN